MDQTLINSGIITKRAKLVENSTKYENCQRTTGKNRKQKREATTGRKAVIMVACLFLHFTVGGISVALGVIYVDFIRVFNAPHSQAALVQSLFIGTVLAGGVLFTSILQKFGTGIPVIIASCIAGVSFVASSFAPNVPTLIALIGVISGLAMCITYLAPYLFLAGSFQENTKVVLGILMLGWTIGQISFPYVSEYLVNEFNWDGSLVLLSGFIFNSIPCGLVFYTSENNINVGNPSEGKSKQTLSECLRDYVYILYIVAVVFYVSVAPVETWFIADMVILKGFERSVGTFLLSLIGITALVGRITGIVFLQIFKVPALVHFSWSIMICGIAHYLVGYFNEFSGLVFAVVLRGLSSGMNGSVVPGTQIEIRGIEMLPQTVAVCNLIGGVSQTLGGLLGGATVDLTGGYDLIFTLAAGAFFLCAIFSLIAWILRNRQGRHSAPSDDVCDMTDKETVSERAPLISKQGS